MLNRRCFASLPPLVALCQDLVLQRAREVEVYLAHQSRFLEQLVGSQYLQGLDRELSQREFLRTSLRHFDKWTS